MAAGAWCSRLSHVLCRHVHAVLLFCPLHLLRAVLRECACAACMLHRAELAIVSDGGARCRPGGEDVNGSTFMHYWHQDTGIIVAGPEGADPSSSMSSPSNNYAVSTTGLDSRGETVILLTSPLHPHWY